MCGGYSLLKSSSEHELRDLAGRSAVRDVLRLRGLALRVAAGAEHLPRRLIADRHEAAPEIRRDRVVGHVRQLARDLAVLDFPEAIAAELAVVALLVDRVAAAPVDHHAVFRVVD